MNEPHPITINAGTDRADCLRMDADDPLAPMRDRFHLPESLLYFDGNSLGPLPHGARERLHRTIDQQWGDDLVSSWNEHDWIGLPRAVGAKVAPLIGAEADEVVVCDSVSVNLFKLLAAALRLRPGRRTVLCQADHFPTDLYIAQGLVELLGGDVELRTAPVDGLAEGLADALDESVAVVSLGHVDFRSGRLLDMAALTAAVHDHGALVLWDLSHSAGALPVELGACGADLAVGCGYKFLNGGPGAPSFLYVARRHQEQARNPLAGWLGHRNPFAFSADYEPAPGVDRFVCGTPPILALSALDAALELWQDVDLELVRRKSKMLGDLFLALVVDRCAPWMGPLELACDTDADARGSQVCLRHPQGHAIVRALIEKGVVGDFRAPDILRFGLCPLYLRHVDAWDAVAILREVLETGLYRHERFQQRQKVT